MKRRQLIILLGGATAAATLGPYAARSQPRQFPVIGMLTLPDPFAGRLRAFRQGLSEVGYEEGRNVTLENNWDGRYDMLPAAAADLVRRGVNVIVATSTPGARAAMAATQRIPIVFSVGVDPVDAGLVASLNRPGGNLTGISTLNVELGSKHLELLHELVPGAAAIALLVNPTSPAFAEPVTRQLRIAADSLKLRLHVLTASSEADFERVFAQVAELRVGALVIASDPFLNSHSAQLAALALRHKLPTMHQFREFPAAGGLMGYGGNITTSYRLVGVYAGRILKGEKPADLPVQQTTRVELFINLKTAAALGLTIPPTLLARADEVIE